jgi:glycine betaine/proline transport system permease protein
MQVTTAIAEAFRSLFDWLQRMVSVPNFPRRCPRFGWLGCDRGRRLGGVRRGQLAAGPADRWAPSLSFGLFGYWSDSIDLLIVTFLSVGVRWSSACRWRC